MIKNVLYRMPVVCFLCFFLSTALAQVSRQPYLQIVTPNSITIRWDTQSSEVGTVYYGSTATSLTSSKTESIAKTKHEITIPGLSPKQKYYYSIAGPSGGAADQYFVTAPTAGSAQPTRIWVVSDFGQSASSGDNLRRNQTIDVWKTFNNNDFHTDFMLSLGDQSEVDTELQLQEYYFNQLNVVFKTTPVYTIAGNHEDNDGQVGYRATFSLPAQAEAGGYPSGTRDYYSFNYGNIHVVGLTVEGGVSISGAQKTWLQNDLANNKSDWLIAFMHRPMHSAGYHPTDKAGETAPQQKAHWLPLLEAAGVDLILSGHNHVYERSYLLDNLIGNSTSITGANKIDTSLGRIDVGGAYRKVAGQPHQGTIFISCEAGGTSNDAKYLTTPFSFFPVVVKGSDYEGSLVIDIDGSNRMDVKFLCDEHDVTGNHVWDYFSIIKTPKATAVARNDNLLPRDFSVANYPNPFNPSTKISYSVPATGLVYLGVYDLLGRKLSTLVDEVKDGGIHSIEWSGRDERGNELASGVYVAQLRAGGFVKNAKMIFLR
jgi:hypothetical protein